MTEDDFLTPWGDLTDEDDHEYQQIKREEGHDCD